MTRGKRKIKKNDDRETRLTALHGGCGLILCYPLPLSLFHEHYFLAFQWSCNFPAKYQTSTCSYFTAHITFFTAHNDKTLIIVLHAVKSHFLKNRLFLGFVVYWSIEILRTYRGLHDSNTINITSHYDVTMTLTLAYNPWHSGHLNKIFNFFFFKLKIKSVHYYRLMI